MSGFLLTVDVAPTLAKTLTSGGLYDRQIDCCDTGDSSIPAQCRPICFRANHSGQPSSLPFAEQKRPLLHGLILTGPWDFGNEGSAPRPARFCGI